MGYCENKQKERMALCMITNKMYDTYCKNKETEETNERLRSLYEKWFEIIKNNESTLKELKNSQNQPLSFPDLLTCTDPYFESENKIMIVGKEANHDYPLFDNFCDFGDKYLTNEFHQYKYQYDIANGDKNSYFEKTRKLICNITSNDDENGKKVMSVLVNNLNKISLGGEYTECNSALNKIYEPFCFEGCNENIFVHELRILKPTHIILLCGKNYNNHIKRAYGEDFYKELEKDNDKFFIKVMPVKEAKIFKFKDVAQDTKSFSDDISFSVIHCIHPSARLGEYREKYDEEIRKFSSIDNK